MAFRGYSLVLTGVAQRVSDVYGDGVGVVNAAHDIPYRQVTFQADPTANNPVYVGNVAAVGEPPNNAAFQLQPDASPWSAVVSLGPFDAGPLKLSDFWVIGTANEHIHIGGVPF